VEKILPAISWSPRWMSLMGCMIGCSKFLGLGNTDAWVYGSSGHAFVLNIHKTLCPSGPTAWKTAKSLKLLSNAGFSISGVVSWAQNPDYAQKYLEATNIIREAVENGFPSIVFWADKPEHYIVRGINDDGIFINGAGSEAVPFKPWTKISESDMIEALSVKPDEKSEVSKTVKDSLQFAIETWHGSSGICYDDYSCGFKAFDVWAESFDDPNLNGFGLAYNSQVWAETRIMAVDFLREAVTKLGMKDNFKKSIDCAIVSAECLKIVATLFPFEGMDSSHKSDPARISSARTALETAKNVEGEMIAEFEKLEKLI